MERIARYIRRKYKKRTDETTDALTHHSNSDRADEKHDISQRGSGTTHDPLFQSRSNLQTSASSSSSYGGSSNTSSSSNSPRVTESHGRSKSMSPRKMYSKGKYASVILPQKQSVLQDPIHGLSNSLELNIACVQNCIIRVDPFLHIRGSWLTEPCPPGECFHDVEIFVLPHNSTSKSDASGDWKLFPHQAGAAISAVLHMLGADATKVLRGHFVPTVNSIIEETMAIRASKFTDCSEFSVLHELQLYYVTNDLRGWTRCRINGGCCHGADKKSKSRADLSTEHKRPKKLKRSRSESNIPKRVASNK